MDDLVIVVQNPKEICDILIDKYKFKLKGTGPISFHLGCDFFQDKEGVLCMAPKKYIKRWSRHMNVFLVRNQDNSILLLSRKMIILN